MTLICLFFQTLIMGAVEMLLEKLNLLDKSAVNIYTEGTVSIEVQLTEKVREAWGRCVVAKNIPDRIASNISWMTAGRNRPIKVSCSAGFCIRPMNR